MHVLALLTGLICCMAVALDAFQTIVLPRRATGRFRITRLFFLATWDPWKTLTSRIKSPKRREQSYSVFGPLSLLLLLVCWAVVLIVGFGLFFFSMHSPFADTMADQNLTNWSRLRTDLYVSGTTLFTLGLGDVLPRTLFARVVVIFEAGTGLGFVALVIGYLPVLYGAFSRRELAITMLDARAGSPPTATELIRRHAFEGGQQELTLLLAEWERWAAELLESHISYPVLCYYRSQHDNQNWVAALTAILDTCALIISNTQGTSSRQAQLTFAMCRHALVDIGQVFHLEERESWIKQSTQQRLTPTAFLDLCDLLDGLDIKLCGDPSASARLHAMRDLYEPQACAMAAYLAMPLPGWVAPPKKNNSWNATTRIRDEAQAALSGPSHISEYATSSYLHSSDDHGF